MKDYVQELLHPMTNVEEVTYLLLKELGIKATRTTVSRQILSNPSFPSMLAISETLSQYNVKNISLKTKSEKLFEDFDNCLLVQVKNADEKECFGLIYRHDGRSIKWYNPFLQRIETISFDHFYKIFSGYAMVFDASLNKDEDNYEIARKREIKHSIIENIALLSFPVLSLIVLLFHSLTIGIWNWINLCVTLLLIVGYCLGILLVLHESGIKSRKLNRICTIGNRVNCSAVLRSKASRFIGFPWSVIGTSYFIGLLISLMTSFYDQHIIYYISIIHLLALPYSIFSIYYQYHIVRNWCPLCISIQMVVISIFLCYLAHGSYSNFPQHIELSYIFLLLINLLVAFYLTSTTYQYLKENRQRNRQEYALTRLRHHKDLFTTLLQNSQQLKGNYANIGIILGNKNGRIHIVEICNPYCGHYAKAQLALKRLIEINNDVKLQIIFSVSPNDQNFDDTPVNLFLTLYHNGEDVNSAIMDWFASHDMKVVRKKYPMNDNCASSNTSYVQNMFDFCQLNRISGTPTFFINSYKLPDIYNANDLQYCINSV